ncbi:MAG: MSMEG_4193 family putative phosphomutase [Acidimicrobiales bacterium]
MPPRPPRAPRTKSPGATLVLLVRHGKTPTTGKVLPGRAPGLHLADAGRAQAEAVASRIAGLYDTRSKHRVQAIYASPLERASETAEPIGAQLGLPVSVETGLLECDFGEWTGAELKALSKLAEWKTVQRWPSGWRFPGGESFSEMQARMTGCLATLCARHPGGTLVAVSHADPIKAAVAYALGSHLDLFQRIVVSPCSVSAVAYGDTGPTVLAVNATASLAELRPS